MSVRLVGTDAADVEEAARRLAAGELVAFATETVYGLGARADDDTAVAKIFAAKGRPRGHPLIVHVADVHAAEAFAATIPAVAGRLMQAFWPGPLTVIVPREPQMAAAAAGGRPTIGLRCPAHAAAHDLLVAAQRLGVPGVAAPSANSFGRVSPTTAEHVVAEFGPDLVVLDGGPCRVGIESAIVDASGTHPMLLRPGILTRARLEEAAGEPLPDADASAAAAPGTLPAHYAPRARVRLMQSSMLHTALQMLGQDTLKLAVYSRTVPSGVATGVRHRRMPSRPEQAAHELFSVLRELDDEGVQLIWVEDPPPGPEWDGVRDRLTRAAAA